MRLNFYTMADIPSKRSTIIAEKFIVEGNTFKRAVTDNPRDKIEIEIGDSKQPDFKPQAKISRWFNEVNFSLRAQEHPEAVVRTEGKLIKYITPDYEVHQYELDPGEIGEDGGLEFEWVLPQKPASNVLTATIQTKELNFFYQPALTQEEIDEGAGRPENVAGSYAVYHKTKGGMNRADGMEYKTGKAFHIYRPKVTDKKGKETWAELNIDETSGVLSVTVPQEFLEKAAYPVIVDPTFGYTSVGASQMNSETDYLMGSERGSPTESGSITSLSFYVKTGTGDDGPNQIVWLYNTTGDLFLLQGYSEVVTTPSTNSWNTANYSAGNDLDSTKNYVLASYGEEICIAFDVGSTNRRYVSLEYPGNLGTIDVTAHSLAVASQYNFSIYATYTTANNVSVDADVVILTGSLPAPTVTGKANVAADVVTTTLSVQAPTITGKANVTADVVTKTLSVQAPTVTGIQNVSTAADVVTTTLSLPASTITGIQNVSTTADVVTATGSLPSPTITAAKNVSTTADPVMLTGTLPEPTISTDNVVNVSADADLLTATLSVQAPTVTAIQNETTSANVVTTTLSIPEPTITTTRFVSVVPDAVVLASSLPEPTVTGIQNVSTTTDLVNLTGSLPSATITGSSLTTADLLSLAASLPAPTITAIMNASVTADLITTTLSIPEPTLAVEGGYSGNASWGIDINTFGLVMNKKARIPTWTTSSRPTGRKGLFGWNKVENRMEIYDPDSDSWYYVSGTQI